VHVTFERGAPRSFDLVVGADGIHSNVRRLAFGPEPDYVAHLGYYYAQVDLGGFGTGLAIVGAYVLAGELAAAGGDHTVAFRRYDEILRGYAKVSERASAGPFLAPRTKLRMRLRNWTFRSKLLLRMMLEMTDDFATDIELADYR
jgi:2-polyprenyl-6-methoxyphenol hydroxylase-like FAD-dependent oxidoreductase